MRLFMFLLLVVTLVQAGVLFKKHQSVAELSLEGNLVDNNNYFVISCHGPIYDEFYFLDKTVPISSWDVKRIFFIGTGDSMYYRYNGLFLDQSKSLDQLGVRNNSDLECRMNDANYPNRVDNCPYKDMEMDEYAVEIADYKKITTLETDVTVTPNHLYASNVQLSAKNNTYRDTFRTDHLPDFFVGKEDQLVTCFDSKERVYLYVQ